MCSVLIPVSDFVRLVVPWDYSGDHLTNIRDLASSKCNVGMMIIAYTYRYILHSCKNEIFLRSFSSPKDVFPRKLLCVIGQPLRGVQSHPAVYVLRTSGQQLNCMETASRGHSLAPNVSHPHRPSSSTGAALIGQRVFPLEARETDRPTPPRRVIQLSTASLRSNPRRCSTTYMMVLAPAMPSALWQRA